MKFPQLMMTATGIAEYLYTIQCHCRVGAVCVCVCEDVVWACGGGDSVLLTSRETTVPDMSPTQYSCGVWLQLRHQMAQSFDL